MMDCRSVVQMDGGVNNIAIAFFKKKKALG